MSKIKNIETLDDTAEYHPYDPDLPAVFKEIKNVIQQELPDVQVEHIGSSSVVGVGGKNVIDIAVVQAPDNTDVKQRLYDIGFRDSPYSRYSPNPMLMGSISYQGKDYKILLHITAEDSDSYNKWITFRDYLRTHPEEAKAYDEVKQQAGEAGPRYYQQTKTPFIISIMEKIQKSGHLNN